MTSAETDQSARPTLPQLAALIAISATGSFAGAATALGCTQSAVSQRVASLERGLGVLLVHRSRQQRRVSLTEAGDTLLAAAEQLGGILSVAVSQVETIRKGLNATVRIGLFTSASERVIPPMMAALRRQPVDYRIELVELDQQTEVSRLVRNGDIDLAFVKLPIADPALLTAELLTDPFVLLVPAGAAPVSPDRLARLPLIGLRGQRDPMEAWAASVGAELNWVLEMETNHAVEAMVAAGLGYGAVPRLTLGGRTPSVRRISLAGTVPARTVGIAWRRYHPRLAFIRGVIDIIQRVCARSAEILPPVDGEGMAR
ncbi:LysR family transcriptional regulator [Amycolatopsis circi]|uniref:LysR family transcriptional regulator n=1 Tax=Amycolatopsis circi TaxID=871959 RepID=UPI0013BE98FB|nr:LysR family transcriptional regulator [Amycolatopsis circi]